jgi:hypothetical protein
MRVTLPEGISPSDVGAARPAVPLIAQGDVPTHEVLPTELLLRGSTEGAAAAWPGAGEAGAGATVARGSLYPVAYPGRDTARPPGSSAPPSSNTTTPLHSRLHPWSGRLAMVFAPVRSAAHASGHLG